MILSRWLGLGFVALFAGVGAAFVLTREDDAKAVGGFLPDVCADTRQTTIVRLPADAFGSPVQRIAMFGNHALLVSLHSWLIATSDTVSGPFGSSQRGAPGHIGNAQDGVVTDSAVYILDTGVSSVLRFSRDGRLVQKISLRPTPAAWWQPRQLMVVDDAFVVAALEPDGAQPRWTLSRFTGGRQHQRIYSTPGSSLSGIVGSVNADNGMLTVAQTQEYAVVSVTKAGLATREFTRRDPPRVPFNREDRRRHRAYFARLPAALHEAYAMPNAMPPVVEIRKLSATRYAAAILATFDSAHVEVLDNTGRAICRATPTPVPLPLALSQHGAVWLAEEADETLLQHTSYGNAHQH